jgi:hypothetical protein
MHVCPELLNLANTILDAAKSISALVSTITGHFPPNSRIQGTKFTAAAFATNLPFSVEPVKQMRSHG